MKTLKKLLLISVVTIILLCFVSINASAQTYSGIFGNNLKWSLDSETGVLEINGTGAMNFSSPIETPWFSQHRSKIKSVVISDGITVIGDWSFQQCDNLTDIYIGADVTTISDIAFVSCKNLQKIDVDENNLCFSIDEYGVLFNKDKTEFVLVPFVFSVDEYKIPDSIVYIDNSVFNNSRSEIARFFINTDNMYYSTDSCGVLFNKDKTELILYPDGNTRTNYSIPDGVTTICKSAFKGCPYLQSIIMPNSIIAIGDYALDLGEFFRDIYYIGPEEQYANISVGSENWAFKSATIHFINSIIDSGTCGENLTWTLYAKGVLEINGTGDMYHWSIYSSTPWYIYSSLINSVEICNGVTSIGTYSFGCCYNLESVTIPNSVTTIYGEAFYYCERFTDVYYSGTIEDWSKITLYTGDNQFAYVTIHCNIIAHSHTYTWIVVTEPTATNDGLRKRMCLDCSDEAESAIISATGFEVANCMGVDYAKNIIYGLSAGIDSLEAYTTVVVEGFEWVYELTDNGFGTGTVAKLTDGETVLSEYTILLFGDTDGDGWYDGNDAFLVNLIVNGMLDKDDVGEAVWTAADCNHDGEINEADYELLMSAGLLLNDVDQSKPVAELITNEAYIEYMGLIDQSFEISTDTEANDTNVDDTVGNGLDRSENENNFEIILADIIAFAKQIFSFIVSLIFN